MTRADAAKNPPGSEEDGTSYNLSRLIRISTAASVVSGLFLVLRFLGLAWALYTLYRAITPWGVYTSDTIQPITPALLVATFFILQCFGFSIVMRTIGEAIFVIRDIEENTRRQA